jgi:hypothetical protein
MIDNISERNPLAHTSSFKGRNNLSASSALDMGIGFVIFLYNPLFSFKKENILLPSQPCTIYILYMYYIFGVDKKVIGLFFFIFCLAILCWHSSASLG